MFDEWMKAESLGSYLLKNIVGAKIPCTRVIEEKHEEKKEGETPQGPQGPQGPKAA
jgi:hypothetical protein